MDWPSLAAEKMAVVERWPLVEVRLEGGVRGVRIPQNCTE